MRFYSLLIDGYVNLLLYETAEHGKTKGIACAKAEANVSIKSCCMCIIRWHRLHAVHKM